MLYNLNPNLWGSHCWKFMHYLTMAYPDNPDDNDKKNINNFFLAIANVIPCEKCRVHFALNLKNNPLNDKVLESKYNLINWLNDIHNEVNIRTGKKTFTYEEILTEYANKEICDDNGVEIATIILLIIIAIIIIIVVIK